MSKSLKFQLTSQGQDIENIRRISTNTTIDPTINDLKDRIFELELSLARAQVTDDKAINFHNLGFPSKVESDAWLDLHALGGNFGFLVDFHTLLEHIFHAISGMDALKQLQTVYKLKLSTISDALAVTSFEVSAPRFLSASGSHTVVYNESSCFSHIPSLKKWNDPSSGYKYRMKKELEKFRRAHLTTIRERVSIKSPLYNLATSSLSESITWTTGLINYIDVTYEEYSASKFGTAKA